MPPAASDDKAGRIQGPQNTNGDKEQGDVTSTLPKISTANADQELEKLREDIDRIDLAMHQLLMERGQIIETLIGIKARQGAGSAFRPAREAAILRALLSRHHGLLPLDTVESIWRIIISTFTYVQMPFSVHFDIESGAAFMQDSARFHFGFSVPALPTRGSAAVIAAVAASTGDLGLLAIEQAPHAGVWWRGLLETAAPKIIARLPFVDRPGHPVARPQFVVARPLAAAASRDVIICALELDRWRPDIDDLLPTLGGACLAKAADGLGLHLLVAIPGHLGQSGLRDALGSSRAGRARVVEVGSHAAQFVMAPS